jgi:hypothetical protein
MMLVGRYSSLSSVFVPPSRVTSTVPLGADLSSSSVTTSPTIVGITATTAPAVSSVSSVVRLPTAGDVPAAVTAANDLQVRVRCYVHVNLLILCCDHLVVCVYLCTCRMHMLTAYLQLKIPSPSSESANTCPSAASKSPATSTKATSGSGQPQSPNTTDQQSPSSWLRDVDKVFTIKV